MEMNNLNFHDGGGGGIALFPKQKNKIIDRAAYYAFFAGKVALATVCNHWGQNALEMSFIPCKGIQTGLDSGELFHAVNSVFFVSGTWIPDFTVRRDSGFLAPYYGFQKPRIPDSTKKNTLIPESRLLYMWWHHRPLWWIYSEVLCLPLL